MKDTYDVRLDRLFTAARKDRVATNREEEFFETRLLARLREQRETAPWYSQVWRMVPFFAVLALVIAICTVSFSPSRTSDMFAAITNSQESIYAGSYLAGE